MVQRVRLESDFVESLPDMVIVDDYAPLPEVPLLANKSHQIVLYTGGDLNRPPVLVLTTFRPTSSLMRIRYFARCGCSDPGSAPPTHMDQGGGRRGGGFQAPGTLRCPRRSSLPDPRFLGANNGRCPTY